MESKGFQEYKEQAVSTMTQGELLLLLYDELIKRLTRAGLALEKKDYATFDASVDRSSDIIQYLSDILDQQYAVSQNLNQLYEFCIYQLCRVKIGRNSAVLDQVKAMALDLRDSFRTAQKNNDSGK